MSVYTDNDNQLCCPMCGDVYVHVDQARIAARPDGEDGREAPIAVTARGRVLIEGAPVPAGPTVMTGRRHRIALLGWCENCSANFALVFTQHKGVTFVESVRLDDSEAAVPEPRPQRDEERIALEVEE
jgi:hypothetical protein